MILVRKFNSPFYNAVYRQIYGRRQNVIIAICGSPGTGKSYAALQIAKTLDPTFTKEKIRERVVVDPKDFLKIVTDGNLPAGAAIILDEIGTSMGARDFYTVSNKMLSYVFQTFRYKRLIVIVTLPALSFLDVHCRLLVNFFVECIKIDFNSNRTRCKVKRMSYNKMISDKPFGKFFRSKDDDQSRIKVRNFWIPKVDNDMANEYEKYSHEFKGGIERKSLENILGANERDAIKKSVFNPQEYVDKVLSNKDRYIKQKKSGKQIINTRMLEIDFKIGSQRSQQIKELVEASI